MRKGEMAEGLVARAEAAERAARELEAKVEQLQERLQLEQAEGGRRMDGDQALAKNALLQVEVRVPSRYVQEGYDLGPV